MTELERLDIIKQITEEFMLPDILKQKTDELHKLLLDENVIKYLRLTTEIAELQKRFSKFNGDKNKIIEHGFCKTLEVGLRKAEISHCEHKIWMYGGSYYLLKDLRCELDDHVRKNLEDISFDCGDSFFEHNLYCCLECGKKIETMEWQEFENSHLVIKNTEYLDVDAVRRIYYQLLFENSVEKANSLIVEKIVDKQKILEK